MPNFKANAINPPNPMSGFFKMFNKEKTKRNKFQAPKPHDTRQKDQNNYIKI